MPKNPVIPVFASLLGLFSLWFGFSADYERDFVGNVLPELIGFCLEGIFFVGIFSWMQDRKDQERKGELKASMAGALGFICQLINGCLPRDQRVDLASSDNWARQCRTNGPRLKELKERVNGSGLEVAEEEIAAIQRLLASRLPTLDALLSLAAELSHSHLSAYTLILIEAHKIAEHDYYGDRLELQASFNNMLRLLTSFIADPH